MSTQFLKLCYMESLFLLMTEVANTFFEVGEPLAILKLYEPKLKILHLKIAHFQNGEYMHTCV